MTIGFETIFAHTHLSKHQFANIILLWQTLTVQEGPHTPQHIPQRETFPIKRKLPSRPPRSVKVKSLTPHIKVREWVQKIPMYHTRNSQNSNYL